jgi:hypothetical protein
MPPRAAGDGESLPQISGRRSGSFWAIDINTGGESPQKASGFMRQHDYTLPVAFDDRNVSDRPIGDRGFPSLLILDKSGRIRLIHTG